MKQDKNRRKRKKKEKQLYNLYACTGIYIFIIKPSFSPQIPTQNLWKIAGYVTGKHYFFVSFLQIV